MFHLCKHCSCLHVMLSIHCILLLRGTFWSLGTTYVLGNELDLHVILAHLGNLCLLTEIQLISQRKGLLLVELLVGSLGFLISIYGHPFMISIFLFCLFLPFLFLCYLIIFILIICRNSFDL